MAAQSKNNLDKISLQKDKATTPSELIDIFKVQQAYLLDLSKTIKYPTSHKKYIRNLIKDAEKYKNKNIVGELKHLNNFMEEGKFNKDGIMTQILQANSNPKDVYKCLLSKYHEEYIHSMHRGLKTIESGKTHVADGHKFTCAVQFMDHLQKYSTNKYTPHKELEKTYNTVMENHRQLQKDHDIDLDIS